jgi:phage tail-like protein
MTELTENRLYPIHAFRFQVDFKEHLIGTAEKGDDVLLCSGAFAECTGFEATMEPKVIKEGGRNWGAIQRSGKTSFATLVLKRGMTSTRDMWAWYEFVGTGKYAHRLNVVVTLFDTSGNAVLAWKLAHALPIKFKSADMNAKGTDVAIEELHLAHEGLSMLKPAEITAKIN